MDNVTFLGFIEENYIWILIIIVVILMTAIGYIADKTNFISKNKKDKKKSDEQEEKLYTKKDIEEILKQKEIMDNDFKQSYENNNLDIKNAIEQDIDLEENNVQEEMSYDDINNQEIDLFDNDIDTQEIDLFDNEINTQEEVLFDSDMNIEENNLSDNNIDFSENDSLSVNEDEEKDENAEDLYVGLDGTPNAFNKEEPTIDIELPDIEELKQGNYEEDSEEESDDDMWKF